MNEIPIERVVHALVDQDRAKEFAASDQLSLGELILKLEAVTDKDKTIVFDFGGQSPAELMSWRGIYRELAIGFHPDLRMNVSVLLEMLKNVIGKTLEGYKGGDFTMSRATPVWVANYGDSGVPNYKGDDYANVAVVNVVDVGPVTEIITAKMS